MLDPIPAIHRVPRPSSRAAGASDTPTYGCVEGRPGSARGGEVPRCGASSFYRFLWIGIMRFRDDAALQHHRLKHILSSILYPPDSILSQPHHAIAPDPV